MNETLYRRLTQIDLAPAHQVLRSYRPARAVAELNLLIAVAAVAAGVIAWRLPTIAIPEDYIPWAVIGALAVVYGAPEVFGRTWPITRWGERLARWRWRRVCRRTEPWVRELEGRNGFLWHYTKSLEHVRGLAEQDRSHLVIASHDGGHVNVAAYCRALVGLRRHAEAERRQQRYDAIRMETNRQTLVADMPPSTEVAIADVESEKREPVLSDDYEAEARSP